MTDLLKVAPLTRRGFLASILAAAVAPVIIKIESLMRPVAREQILILPDDHVLVDESMLDGLPDGFAFRWEPYSRVYSVISRRDYDDEEITPAMRKRIERALKLHNQEHLANTLLDEPVRVGRQRDRRRRYA